MKYTWIPSIVVVFVVCTLQLGWFHPAGETYREWEGKWELDYSDFEGYTDIFTKYDGGIRSSILLKDDSLLKAVFYPKYTWINWWDKGNSYFLLQHERYHFNITETVARNTRKDIIWDRLLGDEVDLEYRVRSNIKNINTLQYKYDTETNHSIRTINQSLWQFKVDSTLIALDKYFAHDLNHLDSTNVSFHRFIEQIGDLIPKGRGMVLPYEKNEGSYYKFILKDNKPVEIRYFNKSKLTPDPYYNVAIVKINRDLSENTYEFYDKEGNPTGNRFGFQKMLEVIKGNETTYTYFDTEGNSASGITEEYKTIILRNTQSGIASKIFMDKFGERMINNLGQYELRYTYETHPKRITVFNYDKAGRISPDNNGNELYYFEYGENSELVKHFTRKTKDLISLKDSIAITEYGYDEFGFESMESFYDLKMNPKEYDGVWRTIRTRDRYDNINLECTFNSNGMLVEKDGIALRLKVFNSDGLLIEYAEYDKGKRIVFDDNNFGKVRYKYDSLERTIELWNLNGYDFPVASNNYGPISLIEYDSSSNFVVTSNFRNIKNENAKSIYGSSRYIETYDSSGNFIQGEHFDEQGNRFEVQQDVAVFRYNYDSAGNKVESAFFNKYDHPAYANQGAHINRYVYDHFGRMIERSYYDTLGQLIEFNNHAKIQWEYNDQDEVIRMNYFDEKNEPDDGIAYKTITYKSNREVENAFYDKHGNPINGSPAIIKYEYDANGNLTQEIFYDGNLNPVNNSNGEHANITEFDMYDRKIREYSRDSNFDLINRQGTFYTIYKYDYRNNLIELARLDENNELIENQIGIATEKYKYNLSDERILESYYNSNNELADGKGYAMIHYERNESGDITKKTYLDVNGHITNNQSQIAQIVTKYNRNGGIDSSDSLSVELSVEFNFEGL